jgi:hypothetical protein
MRNSIFFFFLFSASLFGQAPTSSVNPESFTSGSISDTSKVRVYSRRDGANRKFEFWKLRLMFAPHARTSPIAYTPSASGNVSNKGEMVVTVAGNPYYIDGYGAAIQTNKLINSSVTSAHIVNSTITTNDILNATILGEDIGDMDASSGQVLTWTGSTWEPQAGSATSEPSRQIVFGTGSGVDSDTSLILTSTKVLTQKVPILSTSDVTARRVIGYQDPAESDTSDNLYYDKFIYYDPAESYMGSDSLTIGVSLADYGWTMQNYNSSHELNIKSPGGVHLHGGYSPALRTSATFGEGAFSILSEPSASGVGAKLYDHEVFTTQLSGGTYMAHRPIVSGTLAGQAEIGIQSPDTNTVLNSLSIGGNGTGSSFLSLSLGYFNNTPGSTGGRGIKGNRFAAEIRTLGGNKNFSWFSIDHAKNDTTSNFVGFYNRRYYLPNAAPSATSTTKSRLEWTGETPAFASTLTNTATLDFPSTAAGTVSDLTVTVTGAADGDIVQIGVPNAAVSATGSYFAWVSATNTVTIRLKTEATEDPASASFKVWVIK